MLAAKLLGRRCVSIFASPVVVIRPIQGRCSIHTTILAQQVAHLAAAQRWSWLVNAIWLSAATRVVRFVYQVPGVELMALNQLTASSHIQVYSPSNSHLTILARLLLLLMTLPSSSKRLPVKTALIPVRKTSRLRHILAHFLTMWRGYALEF